VIEGFSYIDKELHCESTPLSRIAEEVGTPAYVYSKAALINRVRRLQEASNTPFDIYFAVKACSNIHILRLLNRAGCGADIVSGGELFRASVAQIPPQRIVFSGVGKSDKEIGEAIKAGIHIFNVESLAELEQIERIAAASGATPKVALRVNPDVDAKTHPHISTGLKKNKFGLAKSELREIYKRIQEFPNVRFCGLSCHIGSQILSESPFAKAWKYLLQAAKEAPFKVTHLDLGGGLGISYSGEKALSLENYARLIHKTFQGTSFKLGIEPGRALVGPTAVLLSRLTLVKRRNTRSFYVVDAAMNDLIRPALYGALHPVIPVTMPRTRTKILADLVGPVCETGDTFETQAKLPPLEPGSLLAFTNSGAYGMSMASQYNSRPRVPEVLVEGSTYSVIRSRETYADLIEHELL
jgi:diaminopimelate decarboxylase